ncbi:UNVERIFIED_CONTAM: hypothetical protein FKN15_071420 [Acipenser sinensis]
MKLKSHCTFFHTLSSIAWKRKTGPQCRLWSSDRPTAPLGARILTDPKKVFEHNMWDHVQWSHQEKEDARKKAIENSCVQIPLEERDKYDKEAGKYWDEFYKTHQNKFFKDRNWLFFEFPELLSHRREGFGVEEGQCNVAVPSNKYDKEAGKYWDEFYKTHQNKFFKDRNWLFFEFPELLSHRREGFGVEEGQCNVAVPASKSDLCNSKDPQPVQSERFSAHSSPHTEHRGGVIDGAVSSCGDSGRNNETWKKMKTSPGSEATFRIFEVGCGAGNSVFPIVNALNYVVVIEWRLPKNGVSFVARGIHFQSDSGRFVNQRQLSCIHCLLFVKSTFLSKQTHQNYSRVRCHAFVHDVCEEAATFPFPDESLDIILLVFVLSSIHPERMQGVVNRLTQLLKPGGTLLFRDYGRYDLSQLRFKRALLQALAKLILEAFYQNIKGRCLSENFYVRGDGTCVYFFTKGHFYYY